MLVAQGSIDVSGLFSQAADGLDLVYAGTHQEAFARVREGFHVALVDLRIPGGGLSLAGALATGQPRMPVLLYGSDPTSEELEEALNLGLAGFLRLPMDVKKVRDSLTRILGRTAFKSVQASSQQAAAEPQPRARRAGLLALAKLIEQRDTETGLHVERVAAFSEALAFRLRDAGVYVAQLDDNLLQSIGIAAWLHDIGKVSIPDAILRKPGRLAPDEFELMKTHCVKGWEVIQAARRAEGGTDPELVLTGEVIRHHHERWDGLGYPDGLKGEATPLAARIVAVIDAYDAMRSKRLYNPERGTRESLEEIQRCAGSHFDPRIAEVFLRHADEFEQLGRTLERVTARWK